MLPPNMMYLQMDMPDGHQDLKIDTLKDLEIFNNMENLKNNPTSNPVKPIVKVSSKLRSLVDIFEKENQGHENSENEVSKTENSNRKCNFARKKIGDAKEQLQQQSSQKQFHSLPYDLREHSMFTGERKNSTTEDGNEQTMTTEEIKHILGGHDFRRKDHGSDSDSAVSSAPPSISPQPAPADMQTTDIWQTFRTYAPDIEKLQKDFDALQTENERLRSELNIAKDRILANGKPAVEGATRNTKLQSLLDRIQCLEQEKDDLLNECNDLKEQNELLEFRVLELENNSDKWSPQGTPQSAPNEVKNAEKTTEQKNIWSCGAAGSNNGTYPDIYEYTKRELSQRITKMLHDHPLPNEDQKCLKQVQSLLSQESTECSSNGTSDPDSFSTNSSSDESCDFEFAQSSKSSSSSAHTLSESLGPIIKHLSDSFVSSRSQAYNSRIVATVQPYNSSQIAPHNSPNEPPRRSRAILSTPTTSHRQSSSPSKRGAFVGSDFFSHASTQPDTSIRRVESRLPVSISTVSSQQYYQNRLRQLENKLLVYESSGDLQAKHLSDRLQREVQLEKELTELRDRVAVLQRENAQLEEEKCEFEEAENDTRLRLQRLEIELEVLSQRNVELELSKEALSAKYKDCRSECLILREDLSANETQLRNISEDKRRAKENLEFLHSLLPLLIAYNLVKDGRTETGEGANGVVDASDNEKVHRSNDCDCCNKLKDRVHCLQTQLRQCKERCHEAMESADSHWLDLELEYKEREKIASAKEASLKQKITQLESILHADACAANEKITQMEETEKELKTCLMRISKEQKDILNDHENILREYETCREELLQLKETTKPLSEALEEEKKRSKLLQSELCVLQRVHSDVERRAKSELKTLKTENSCLRRDFQNCEVTNGELREEVAVLEKEIQRLQLQLKSLESRIFELMEEIRTKEEICARLENEVKRNEGKCLALELGTSKTKLFSYKNEDDEREARSTESV